MYGARVGSAPGRVRTVAGAVLARWLAAGLLGTGCAAALASGSVLVEKVPSGLDKTRVLAVVRDALQYRAWTIVPTDKAESVAAKIERSTVLARILIWQQDDKLLYEESAEDGRRAIDFRGTLLPPRKIPTPPRWIAYLRSDIAERLQSLPAGAPAAAPESAPSARSQTRPADTPARAAKAGAVQRMQELKDLLDKGLISKEEYEQKRLQILSDL